MGPPAFFAAAFGIARLIELVADGHPRLVQPNVFCFDLRTCRQLDWGQLRQCVVRQVGAFATGGRLGLLSAWRRDLKELRELHG